MRSLPLSEVEAAAEFGGKAVELGAALRAGLPVPDGVALDVELTAELAQGRGPPGALAEIVAAVGGALAVRSSAVGEDSASASFAGQHASVLNVRGERALAEAIARVYESAHAEAALAYRQKLGVEGEPRVAVVVQRLVDADVAGVLFTRNPMTGADERVVEAAFGLGEAVVAGLVTPDHYRLARDGAVLERRVGDKDIAVRAAAGGGTAEVPLGPGFAALPCLDDGALARLNDLAARCEAAPGGAAGALDLEWALAGGRLFLLQRRPVTR